MRRQPRGRETPFAAHRRRLRREPARACSALALLALILLVARVRAADLAAESLRPGAARRDGQPAAARVASRRRRLTFWLGTDDQGRDMLSAIFYGLRISLGVGVASTLLRAGHRPRRGPASPPTSAGGSRALIMRIVDIQLSFPAILIALILLAVLGQGIGKIDHRAGRRCSGPTTRAPCAARRWSRRARSTSRRRAASRCRPRASCSATCCPTACRR